MAIQNSIPLLNCHHIEKTSDFYQQAFQFVIVNKREYDGELQWVHLMHGATSIMLQTVTESEQPSNIKPSANIDIFFFIDNIRELHHFINAKFGGVSALTTTDYQMQEFSVFDPEGNRILLGEKG